MSEEKDLHRLVEDAEDELFQAIVDRMDRLEAPELEPGPGPPPEALARWRAALGRLERVPAVRNRRRLGLRIAVVIAILAGVFFLGAHALTFNWIELVREEYTQIQLRADTSPEEVVDGWTDAFRPSCLPEDYHMSDAIDGADFKAIEYTDTEGHRIMFYQYGPDSNVRIDTESAEVRRSGTVNGHTAYWVQKGAVATLYWNDGQRIFFIEYAPECLSDAEILNFAEHITKNK